MSVDLTVAQKGKKNNAMDDSWQPTCSYGANSFQYRYRQNCDNFLDRMGRAKTFPGTPVPRFMSPPQSTGFDALVIVILVAFIIFGLFAALRRDTLRVFRSGDRLSGRSIVMIHSNKCSHCVGSMGNYRAVAGTSPPLNFYTCEADVVPDAWRRFLRAYPTFAYFQDEKMVAMIEGAVDAETLRRFVQSAQNGERAGAMERAPRASGLNL
jgi:hypothetical protein